MFFLNFNYYIHFWYML